MDLFEDENTAYAIFITLCVVYLGLALFYFIRGAQNPICAGFSVWILSVASICLSYYAVDSPSWKSEFDLVFDEKMRIGGIIEMLRSLIYVWISTNILHGVFSVESNRIFSWKRLTHNNPNSLFYVKFSWKGIINSTRVFVIFFVIINFGVFYYCLFQAPIILAEDDYIKNLSKNNILYEFQKLLVSFIEPSTNEKIPYMYYSIYSAINYCVFMYPLIYCSLYVNKSSHNNLNSLFRKFTLIENDNNLIENSKIFYEKCYLDMSKFVDLPAWLLVVILFEVMLGQETLAPLAYALAMITFGSCFGLQIIAIFSIAFKYNRMYHKVRERCGCDIINLKLKTDADLFREVFANNSSSFIFGFAAALVSAILKELLT